MNPKRNASSRLSFRVFGWGVSQLLAAAILSSCSTVSSKRHSGNATESGLNSARELAAIGSLLELPFGAIGVVGETAGGILRAASQQEKRGHHDDAAGNYLKAAVEARALMVSGEGVENSEAELAKLQLHNASLARFAEIWSRDFRREGPSPYHLDGGGEHFEIVLDPGSDYRPAFFDEIIAADSIRGKGVVEKKRAGYGAPLVGICTPSNPWDASGLNLGLEKPISIIWLLHPSNYTNLCSCIRSVCRGYMEHLSSKPNRKCTEVRQDGDGNPKHAPS